VGRLEDWLKQYPTFHASALPTKLPNLMVKIVRVLHSRFSLRGMIFAVQSGRMLFLQSIEAADVE
jgi:hypothetical protein